MPRTPERFLSSLIWSFVEQGELFLREPFAACGDALFDLLEFFDRLTDRCQVGEHTAEPAFADIEFAALFSQLAHDRFGLFLCADEKNRFVSSRQFL